MTIKKEGVMPLLVSFAMDALVVKTLAITHFNDPPFNFSLRRTSFS